MINENWSLAAIVQLEHIPVAVLPPPGAQLSVPAAGQRIKEFRMLHADHGEEVLVAQVTPETVLVGQRGHVIGLQQLVVENRGSHFLQVQ